MRKQVSCVSVVVVCVAALISAMPQGGKDTDTRVGLDRPSTSPVPEVSECGLDALIGDVFGGGGNSNCNNNNPNTNTGGYNPPPPDTNNGGYNPPPNNNNGGYNPPPDNNNGAHPKDCECVPFYLCDDNNTIIEDGVGLLDIRIKDECGAYDQKCCGGTNVRPPDNPVITPRPPPVTPTENRCGVRNFDGVGVRITGAEDNEAQYGEFPWMVAVVQPDASRSQDGKPVNVYQCGGSLIHPQVVLTGAHCVRGKNNLVIRAGEWDTQTKNELYPTQDRNVREVIIHEQFNNNTLFNDPALLILENPVDTSFENVGLICLPEENENMDGRDCVASGWGKDQFGKEGKYQVILKRVDVPIVPREPCLELLRKTRLGTHFKLHQSFICAGGRPGKDTCKGDGGSPLACPSRGNTGVYVQAGIVAWGINCGTETPGVYVNVPSFVSWIYNKLQQRGISIVSGSGNSNIEPTSNGDNQRPRPDNNGDHNTSPDNTNDNGYNSASTNNNNSYNSNYNNNGGGNNHGEDYKPPSGNNNGGDYSPTPTENNNNGVINNPSNENSNNGVSNNPSNGNNNNGEDNPSNANKNNGVSNNPSGGNNNNGVSNNPSSGNNNNGVSNNPSSENNNNGVSNNPSSGNNNNGVSNNPSSGNNNNGVSNNPFNGNNNNGVSNNPFNGNNNNGVSNNPSNGNNYNNGGSSTEKTSDSHFKDCKCVAFHRCNDSFLAEDLLDIRIKDECGAYDQRCCEEMYIMPPNNSVITPKPPPVTPTENRCGIRNFDGVGVRITGAEDNEAQYGEFPWMVAVVQPDASRSQDGEPVKVYQCGGSLIHPQVVLTGAHCVKGKNNLVIRAGEWDTQTKNELYPTQDRNVREVIIHQEFNNNTLFNDPALLILESAVDTSLGNVGLICLPDENENMDGRDCVASGWGKDQYGKEGKYQVILKRVDMPIVPREPCLELLHKTRLGTHFKLHPSFICAGGRPGKDTCKGDGGSPLACPSRGNTGVYVQAGIVAWGINCGSETPGVYVNVPSFVTWIDKNLKQRGISLLSNTN